MDVKGVLIFSFGSLLFSILVITGLLYFLSPDSPVESGGSSAINEPLNQSLESSTLLNIEGVATLEDSLEKRIDILQSKLNYQQIISDSLNGLLSEKITQAEKYLKDIENLQQSIVDIQTVEDQAKSLAKTFESMKINEIGRSVADLDDKALMQIYNKMNGRLRKNLLMAVSSERAAKLTKKMMSLASE